MRSKEDAKDYRYFPDPDLPPVCISDEWLESVRAALPELQPEKMARYQSEYGLSEYDSRILTESKKMADMFEKTTTLCQKPKKVANWLIGEASRLLKEKGEDAESLWFSPIHLAQLTDLVDAGTINNNTAKEVFTAIFEQDVDRPPMSMHTDLAWSMTTVLWNRQFPMCLPQTRRRWKSTIAERQRYLVSWSVR